MTTLVRTLLVLTMASVLLAACGGGSPTPTRVPRPPTPTPSPIPIEGPLTLASGGSDMVEFHMTQRNRGEFSVASSAPLEVEITGPSEGLPIKEDGVSEKDYTILGTGEGDFAIVVTNTSDQTVTSEIKGMLFWR